MAKFDQHWVKVKNKVLFRQQPITTLHWQFLNPYASNNIRLHRYVLFNSHKEFPFLLRLLGLSFVYLKWWFFSAWLCIYRSYKNNHKQYSKNYNVSARKQFASLILLSYGFNVPPNEYYKLRLHRWSSKQWLDFIYDFQAQAWHNAFSNGSAVKGQQEQLKDKLQLEHLLQKNDLACVKTLKRINRNTPLSDADLASLPEHLFLKPLNANQALGCYFYRRCETDSYALNYFRNRQHRYQLDLEQLQSLISNQDYLFQELLCNHDDVSSLFKVEECVVLRIVTTSKTNLIDTAFCFAEIPTTLGAGSHWIIQVDLHSHRFVIPEKHTYLSDAFEEFFATIGAHECPFSEQSINLCVQAHGLLPQIPSIAWDVALAQKGPAIIEGNSAWGCATQQKISAIPALNGKLGEHFTQLAYQHE